MPEAARTLVKSPPELWAEVSDPQSLARHLGDAGEIRITRLDPESTVVWEGDRMRGTVDLAPAGWGTKVTVTAEETGAVVEPPAEEPQAAVEPAPEPDPDVEPEPEAEAPRRGVRGFFARLFGKRDAPVAEPEPEPVAVAEPEPEPERAPAPEPERRPGPDTEALLDEMLGSLGAAHHRPFSR